MQNSNANIRQLLPDDVCWKQSITKGGFDIMHSVTDLCVGVYLKR
jgi:hypothetical protein